MLIRYGHIVPQYGNLSQTEGVWSCQLRGGWVQCRKRKREPLARKALWKTNTVIASEADIAPNSLTEISLTTYARLSEFATTAPAGSPNLSKFY